jgi:hypothetical protein
MSLTWRPDEQVTGDVVADDGRSHYRIHCLRISGRETYLARWHRNRRPLALNGETIATLPTLEDAKAACEQHAAEQTQRA